MKKIKSIAFVFCALFAQVLPAQQLQLPLNRQWSLEADAQFIKDTALHVHSSMRPVRETSRMKYTDYVSANIGYGDFSCNQDTATGFGKKVSAWCCRKHHGESFINVRHSGEDGWLNLRIDPLFNLQYGKKDFSDTAVSATSFMNTRGVMARGDIGNKFSFETSFWENQSTFPDYIKAFNDKYLVVPGQGRWKKFKTRGYDYAMASGYMSYSPCKNFNVQLGHGKHLVGDGYRSLLLSDNSFNYPYARFTTNFRSWLQYTNIYASLMNLIPGGNNIPPGTERLFQKKAASFHHLNVRIFKKKRLQLGVFQGLIWEAADTNNRQHLNFHYFNPVMFTSLPHYGLNSSKNAMLGLTWKWRFMRSIEWYGQCMLDEKGEKKKPGSIHNKRGFQAGVKYFNVLRIPHLHLQLEYNQVRPYAYATRDSLQNWSHYNQALAHPLGANFKEYIGFLNYKIRDFYIELRYSVAEVGADSSGRSFGSNIFASDHDAFYGVNSTVNEIGQGVSTNIVHQEVRIGYVLSYATNLNLFAGYSNRIFTAAGSPEMQTPLIYFGLRTALNNLYWDF
ncbi:MAG: hypothetical protein FD123_1154 [Bacteroidetes bacterium]|nr:MAG: hypothetical protein FD123_1154 [Bacteroidota bacterium]